MAKKTTTAAAAGHGKQHKSTTAAVVKNKATTPMVRFADMRAASGERMSVTRAKMAEKLIHMRASMRVTLARVRHPINPVHRVAVREAAKETKAAATERRKQAVATAKNISAGKRATIREKRARQMNRTVA